MSFQSNIRHKLIIGKIFGIIYVPLNINTRRTIVDYLYPMPFVLAYFYCMIICPSELLNLPSIPEAKEIVYAMWLLLLQCSIITIIKWIYSIVQRSRLHDLMINVNRLSMEYGDVNLKRKSINNFVCTVIILIYVALHCVFNAYIQDKIWFYYLFSLPMEIANFEQYFIHSINNELYLMLKYINSTITLDDAFRRQINIKKIKNTYDDYKKIVLIAEEANKTFGFFMLCSLSFTLIALISGSYEFQIKNLQPSWIYYSNLVYITVIVIRLFFTIYNWNIVITQVNRTPSLIHNTWNKYDGTNVEIKELLRVIASELSRKKLKFTVYDFVALDWTLLYMITGSVSSYTVIMMQFHISNKNANSSTHETVFAPT